MADLLSDHLTSLTVNPPAMESVIGTVELLELVLLQLDIIDLLRCQRVSKQWLDIIRKSPQLQEALFMTNISTSSCTPSLNYLIQQSFRVGWGLRTTSDALDEDQLWIQPRSDHQVSLWKEPSASWQKMYLIHPAQGFRVWHTFGGSSFSFWCDKDTTLGAAMDKANYIVETEKAKIEAVKGQLRPRRRWYQRYEREDKPTLDNSGYIAPL